MIINLKQVKINKLFQLNEKKDITYKIGKYIIFKIFKIK